MFDYTTYPVPIGGSKRFDCPICGGKNTLVISNKDGKLLFCCFRASCDQKGSKTVGLKLDNITTLKALPPPTLTIPDTWVKPYHKDDVIKWLKSVNCWNQFVEHKAEIFYDLARNRVVFLGRNHDGLLGLGRSLDKNLKPKWYVYPGSSKQPFVCGPGKAETCVIVEDAASAVAVSRFLEFDGVALIGTHLTQEAINIIIQYKKALICLDKDASQKAIAHSRTLSPFIETRIVMLNEDLRYLDDDDLYSILHL